MPISLAIALIEAPAWIRGLTVLIYCIDNIPAPPTYIYMCVGGGGLINIHGLFRFLPVFFYQRGTMLVRTKPILLTGIFIDDSGCFFAAKHRRNSFVVKVSATRLLRSCSSMKRWDAYLQPTLTITMHAEYFCRKIWNALCCHTTIGSTLL